MNNYTNLIDNWVARRKAEATEYPEAVALGALKAKFDSFLWYVEDLIDAVEDAQSRFSIEFEAERCRTFLEKMKED